jgi:predicted ArsR family transcriptional regulator
MSENGNGRKDRTRGERGKFGTEYDREEFIHAVETAEHATAKGVAERVGCTPRHARERLRALEENGVVESTDLGRTNLWRLTN